MEQGRMNIRPCLLGIPSCAEHAWNDGGGS